MPIHDTTDRHELPSGTLELLILRSVSRVARHGWAISHDIKERSDGALLVEEGSLYPALHRLVRLKQLKAEWGTSEHNRKARFYTLTATGRRRLEADTARWRAVSSAVTTALAASALPQRLGVAR
jgi:transcriptional regulator